MAEGWEASRATREVGMAWWLAGNLLGGVVEDVSKSVMEGSIYNRHFLLENKAQFL
jgi:hypothetical protein